MTNSKLSSDEIKEMDCEHCKRDGCRGIPATGFCEDCCDFVCGTCLRYHKRYEPDHIFKQTNKVSLEFYSEICDKHSDEFTKFYCETCDDVACSVCKRQYHPNCSYLVHLSKYRTSLEDTKRTDLIAFIEESKAKINFMRKNIEQCLKFGNTLKDNAKVTIRKLRENLDKEFDMLEAEINELELPDQAKMQTCLKDAMEIEKYISRVNLASEGYKKFVVLKKIKKLVENMKDETESLEKVTGILEYSYVLGGVLTRQKTGIKANVGETDKVKEESSKTLRNDCSETDDSRSVTRSVKLLAPKHGVHWLGLFLQTFLFELTIIVFCFDDFIYRERLYRDRHIPTEIVPWVLGVGLFLSCLCRLVIFMQITDFANYKYGFYITNMLLKLWSITAYCITVPLSIVNLLFHVLPILLALCVYFMLFLSHKLTPCAGVPLKMLFACAYSLVQKVGLVVSLLVLSVADFIVITLYFNSNIYRWNLETPLWLIIFFFIHIYNHLILISSFGIRYIEIWKRGKSDFGWFFSNKTLFNLRQCVLLCIAQCMPQSN